MDETLETMLRALEGLDAPSVSDRVSALDALSTALPQLSELSPAEWDVKLSRIEDDLEDLDETADEALARSQQAHRAFETLKRFAANRGVDVTTRAEGQAELFDDGRSADADGRRQNPVAQAESTRGAILQVMKRRPHLEWTPTAVSDHLARYGRRVARSNVQVTLRRLATDGQVRKVGRGAYVILPGADSEATREEEPRAVANTKPEEATNQMPVDASGRKGEARTDFGPGSPRRLEAGRKAAETRRRQAEAKKEGGSAQSKPRPAARPD